MAGEVAALQQYRTRAGFEQLRRGAAHVVDRSDRTLEQAFGFGDVRREQVGAGQQMPFQRRHQIRFRQIGAGRGNQHRIENDGNAWMRLQRRGDFAREAGASQHADLDRADVKVLQHRVDLRAQHVRRNIMDGGDAERVLRGDGGDCAETMHPKAANVRRSAWMPAPPPESEPAMVNASGGRACLGVGMSHFSNELQPSKSAGSGDFSPTSQALEHRRRKDRLTFVAFTQNRDGFHHSFHHRS